KDPEAIGSQIEVKKDEQKKILARIEELTRYIKAVNSYVENPTQEKQQGVINASNGKIHDDLKAIFDLAGEKYQDNMVFVSIHVNSTSAAEQTSASGIRVFYKGNKNQTYYLDYDETARYNFAKTLLDELNESTDFSKKTSSPSLDTRNLSVLREHNFVSALVEAGFINNPNDLQKLVEAQTREDIAAGIYNGIVAHFNKK